MSLPKVQHGDGGSQPGVLSGFEHVNRYWDMKNNVYAAKILPGEYYVTRNGEMVTTVLGSCVSACVRDPEIGVGGMNHFMLPEKVAGDIGGWDGTAVNSATRYGSFAMEHLINVILKQGGRRERLEIKVFGGGKVLRAVTDIGLRNINFIRHYLRLEQLPIATEDLGGLYPRKVNYFPASGRALVKKLRQFHNDTIVRREKSYLHDIERGPVAGEVDLF